MEMIDAYVSEVGRRLPAKQRADIEKEIRSMIEDTLDDESRTQGRPVDEEMAAMVLKRLGSPEKLAASYVPPQYLIGPELFPTYIEVVKIVLSVLFVVALVGVALSVGLSGTLPSQPLASIAQASAGIFSGIFQAFGIITLVFAILQRVSPKVNLEKQEEAFDPRKLKVKPDSEKISQSGVVVELTLTFIAISLFAFFPQLIGVGSLRDGQWVMVPVLSPTFFSYLPYMLALWVAGALLKVAVLSGGRWSPATRWIKVGLDMLGIVLLGIILTGPSLVSLPPDAVTRLGWGKADPGFIAMMSGLFDAGIKVALLIALVVEIIETISTFVKQLLRTRLTPAA